MRVIAGTCRSLPLKTVPGDDVRPTTDRIKETLFNMLAPYIPGCRFLDLFAGSGAIGIEALSRGAEKAWFVDSSRKSIACIEANLAFTRLGDRAEVLSCDALTAILRLEGRITEPLDVIFMDPPYGKGLAQEALERLKRSPLISKETLILVEEKADTDFSFAEEAGYGIIKTKSYGSNKHVWLKKTEEL